MMEGRTKHRLLAYYHEASTKQDLFKHVAEQLTAGRKLMILLTGLPGAGKSTLARQLYKRFGISSISYDFQLRRLAKQHNLGFEEASKLYYKQAFQIVTNQLVAAGRQGKNIVYDSTGMYLARRKDRLSKVPNDYHKIGVYIPVALNVALQRVKTRFDAAPNDSYFNADYITNMHTKQQIPQASEFDAFFVIEG